MERERKAAQRNGGVERGSAGAWLRWLPVAGVALALAALYAAGLQDYLSLTALRRYHGTLSAWIETQPLAAVALYLLVYFAMVAISFPGAGFMTITGGFLFGAPLGTVLAAVAATAGAIVIFLIARTSLGAFLAGRAGPRMRRLRDGFQEEGFSYLLFLRLVPLFPFWLVNLAAASFGMRLLPYVAATAIGVVPPTFVFAHFGQGLEGALESDGVHVPTGLLVALALLAVLALLPVAVRRLRHRGDRGEENGIPTRRGE
jgi:uncharacterized membrane protein YdjX (TVP38/TMEM64 family)